MLSFILKTPRNIKSILAISIDVIIITFSFFGAFVMRYEDSFIFYSSSHWSIYFLLLPPTLFAFFRLGLYSTVLRFVTLHIAKTVVIGSAVSTLTILLSSYLLQISVPRTVPIIYFIFLTLFMLSIRFFFKALLNGGKGGKKSVIIYGAGYTGRQLLTMMNQMPGYFITAFIDDNIKLHKLTIHGVKVYSPSFLPELIKDAQVEQILLAMPSTPSSRRKEIIHSLSQFSCEVMSVPNMEDILSGKAKLTTLNRVSIDELLGRDPISPVSELLSYNIANKVILVTGAGGSIGSELCRQIIQQKPQKLILFELSEFNLYSIESELHEMIKSLGLETTLVPIMGNIQDREHLKEVMTCFGVSTVYHAAAYKHVPLVEYNVVEGCKNNILGTLNCAQVAIESRVETFVLISTDKAVRPTNTMGATKRIAELILQALSKEQSITRFCMVRFGNVLGSSGSVVPLFRKQIEMGGPITLTHPEITRYFMTIPEASQLVIQAGAMGKGGDVFVLDMGESVKIIDLAKRMIQLCGLKEKNQDRPDGDIEIKITGLRPGEKLYEELLIGDNVKKTAHPRIMTAKEVMLNWDKLKPQLDRLNKCCRDYDIEGIRELLLHLPTGFNPVDNICDLIWRNQNS